MVVILLVALLMDVLSVYLFNMSSHPKELSGLLCQILTLVCFTVCLFRKEAETKTAEFKVLTLIMLIWSSAVFFPLLQIGSLIQQSMPGFIAWAPALS